MTVVRHKEHEQLPLRRPRCSTVPTHGLGVALILIRAIALAALMVVGTGGTAQAGTLGAPLRIGILGGYHLTSSDIDLMAPRLSSHQPSSGALAGLRVGVRPARWVEFELTASAVFASSSVGSVVLVPVVADVVLRPFRGDVVPTLALGAGATLSAPTVGDFDADVTMHTALGLELRLSQLLAVRVEAHLFVSDAVSDTLAFSPAFTCGLDFLFWSETKTARGNDTVASVPPSATTLETKRDDGDDGDDGDGLDFPADRCPNHPGPETSFGCPDSDGDGVVDVVDACPTRPGSNTQQGCPDTDKDGVDDRLDACVGQTGRGDRHGCP